MPGTNGIAGNANSVWHSRKITLRAATLILKAESLIRRAPMEAWRDSLGEVEMADGDAVLAGQLAPTRASDEELRLGHSRARNVMRAAEHLPYSPKCLPQAMALQWLLKSERLPSALIIARLRGQGDTQSQAGTVAGQVQDAFHAWVELGNAMLIGHCEKADYRPIMAFRNTVAPSAPDTGSAAL